MKDKENKFSSEKTIGSGYHKVIIVMMFINICLIIFGGVLAHRWYQQLVFSQKTTASVLGSRQSNILNILQEQFRPIVSAVKEEFDQELKKLVQDWGAKDLPELSQTIEQKVLENFAKDSRNLKERLTLLEKATQRVADEVKFLKEQHLKKLLRVIYQQSQIMERAFLRQEQNKTKKGSQAMSLAQQYIEKGDIDMARICLINAINNDPNNIRYFQSLVEMGQKYYSSNVKALQEILSVFQVSLFRIDPDKINTLAALLGKLSRTLNHTLATQEKARQQQPSTQKTNPTSRLEDIDKKFPLSACYKDIIKLEQRISLLAALLEDLTDENKPAPPLRAKVKQKLVVTRKLKDAMEVVRNIEDMLALLEKEKDSLVDSEKTEARLEFCHSLLNLLYHYGLDVLPPNALPQVVLDYISNIPKRVKAINNKLWLAKSRSALVQIEAIIGETHTKENEQFLFQHKIELWHKALRKIKRVLPRMIPPQALREIEEKLTQVNKKIQELRRKQYKAYQEWAAKNILESFKFWDSVHIPGDDDAIKCFECGYLDRIDERLISPEVSSSLHTILDKIYEELDNDKEQELRLRMMTANKMQMEDF